MRQLGTSLAVLVLVPALVVGATFKKQSSEGSMSKKSSAAIDQSLAGNITREKTDTGEIKPLSYDQFRLGVELQVREKRLDQIESLKKIMTFNPDKKEMPGLLFRLGELYWEESKYYFFEANRQDDALIAAINAKDPAAQAAAKQGKTDMLAKRDQYSHFAVEKYSDIVQNYKDYERTDEVLYFLGHNLMETGEDRKALIAYKRLIDKFPKSKFLPDAFLAFGEYYFNNSKGRREMLEKALDYYKRAASYPESQVYGFALYKQGWCYFNLSDYTKAMDLWRAVILYGEFAGASALEKDGGKSGKNTLIREARSDYVRAYSRIGSPKDAHDTFSKVASKTEDLWLMMKQLANLYYDDGKDREAAVTFAMLIHERPLSPEAPGFQGKIVDCILRTGNKQLTVKQVRILVKIIQDVEKSGNVKDDKDRQAIAKARDLSERTLSNLAVNWHNEAKKTRDEETFQIASEVYADYLALFPNSTKAYDLRFFWADLNYDNLQRYDRAAEQYTQVVLIDIKRIENKPKAQKPGKWFKEAAFNAILANDEVTKKAEEKGEAKGPAAGDLKKKLDIPPAKQALLDACERYIKYLPKGEHRVEVGFKAARIYYAYHHYDEAVRRFSEIALNYPDFKFENGDRAGELAANLVLDSFNGLGEFNKVNEWARKFYANEKLAQGQFKTDLAKIIEQSAFKLIATFEEKKQYEKAAAEYLKFVDEFPKTDIVDTAVYNAATDYFKAHRLEKAFETRKRLISNFPRSKFVPICIFANAEGHEAIGDFQQAAEYYETYARNYEKSIGGAKKQPKKHKKSKAAAAPANDKKDENVQTYEEAKAQQALLNAGIYRDGLGQQRLAQKDRDKFLALWPDNKDAEAVFLSIADLYEKEGQYGRAVSQLEAYEKEYTNAKDPEKFLNTESRILGIYLNKMHNKARAAAVQKRSMETYDKLSHRVRQTLGATALDPVGRAMLAKYDADFDHFAHLKLHWGKLPDPAKDFKKSLKEKATSLEAVQRLYTEVVKMKAAEPAICALYKIGAAYQNMAESIANAPMPRGAPQEVQDELRNQLTQQADPIRGKAADAYGAAVNKSRELSVVNDCSQKALHALRDGLRPEQYPPMNEDTSELHAEVLKASSQGGDVVAELQPAVANVDLRDPPRADLHATPKPKEPEPAAESAPSKPAAKTSEVKEDDLNDLGQGDKPSDVKPAPEEVKPKANPSKPATEEPEDSL